MHRKAVIALNGSGSIALFLRIYTNSGSPGGLCTGSRAASACRVPPLQRPSLRAPLSRWMEPVLVPVSLSSPSWSHRDHNPRFRFAAPHRIDGAPRRTSARPCRLLWAKRWADQSGRGESVALNRGRTGAL